jgi:hypothetical protein
MSAEEFQLEIAHCLFIDIMGSQLRVAFIFPEQCNQVDPSCVAIHARHFLQIDGRRRTIITHAALVHEDTIPLL